MCIYYVCLWVYVLVCVMRRHWPGLQTKMAASKKTLFLDNSLTPKNITASSFFPRLQFFSWLSALYFVLIHFQRRCFDIMWSCISKMLGYLRRPVSSFSIWKYIEGAAIYSCRGRLSLDSNKERTQIACIYAAFF